MTRYKGLTGSLSLCFTCLNVESDDCPKFKIPSGKVLSAKEFHDCAAIGGGGVTVQDCQKYASDKSKLPSFALKQLLKMEEEGVI